MKKHDKKQKSDALVKELVDQVFLITEMHKSTKSKFSDNVVGNFVKRWYSKFDGTALQGAMMAAGIGYALKKYESKIDSASNDLGDYASEIIDDVTNSEGVAKEKVDSQSTLESPITIEKDSDFTITPPNNLSFVKNFEELNTISDSLATINSTSLRFSQTPDGSFGTNSNKFSVDDIELNAFSDSILSTINNDLDDINSFSSTVDIKGLSLGSTTAPYSYELESELSVVAGKFSRVESELLTNLHLNLAAKADEPEQYIQMVVEADEPHTNGQEPNSLAHDPFTALAITTLAVGAFAISKLTSIVKIPQIERNLDEIVERGNETPLIQYGDAVQAITYSKVLDTINGLRGFVITDDNPSGLITKAEFKQLTTGDYNPTKAKEFLKKKHLENKLLTDTNTIRTQQMWVNLAVNMQHKRIWVLPRRLFKNREQKELEERVVCANAARTIFRFIGESYNDKTKKNIRELHSYTGDLAKIIRASYVREPAEFKKNHPSLYNAIQNSITSDSFIDTTLMFVGIKTDDKRFESRLANELSPYILGLKVGNQKNQSVIKSINQLVHEFKPTEKIPAQVLPSDLLNTIKSTLIDAAKDIGLTIKPPTKENSKHNAMTMG